MERYNVSPGSLNFKVVIIDTSGKYEHREVPYGDHIGVSIDEARTRAEELCKNLNAKEPRP